MNIRLGKEEVAAFQEIALEEVRAEAQHLQKVQDLRERRAGLLKMILHQNGVTEGHYELGDTGQFIKDVGAEMAAAAKRAGLSKVEEGALEQATKSIDKK